MIGYQKEIDSRKRQLRLKYEKEISELIVLIEKLEVTRREILIEIDNFYKKKGYKEISVVL